MLAHAPFPSESHIAPLFPPDLLRYRSAREEGISCQLADVDFTDVRPLQGVIGSCWLLSALRCMSLKAPGRLRSVVSQETEYSWRVRLFSRDFVVDDRFPYLASDEGPLGGGGLRVPAAGRSGTAAGKTIGCAYARGSVIEVAAIIEKAFVLAVPCTRGHQYASSRSRRAARGVSPFLLWHYCDIDGGTVEFALQALLNGFGVATAPPRPLASSSGLVPYRVKLFDWGSVLMVYCRRRGELHSLCVEGVCKPCTGKSPGGASICVYDPWVGASQPLEAEGEPCLFIATWDASFVRTVRFPAAGVKLSTASVEATF
jgi:hypothetical protein